MGQNALFEEFRTPLHVLCGRLLIMALVPGFIGMASEHWLKAPAGWAGEGEEGQTVYGHVRHLGLWSVCSNFSRCASLPSSDFPDAYAPVRGLVLTALCLHVLSVVVGTACSCEDPDNLQGINKHVPRLEEILAVVAGIVTGSALGVFAQTSHQHPVYHVFHPDWSYWVMVFYVGCLLLAGGVIVLTRRQCACRKRRACCLRHRQQTTLLHQVGNRKPRALRTTSFDRPATERRLYQPPDEKRFKYFVEPEQGTAGLGSDRLAIGDDYNPFLKEMKEPPYVYSSWEGIPRMVQQLSNKRGEIREL